MVHKALYSGSEMDHSLINPNQIRHAGLGFWDNPYDKSRGLKIDVNESLVIPLRSQGTKLAFETRVPTRYELDNCQHVDMTSNEPFHTHQRFLLNLVLTDHSNLFQRTEVNTKSAEAATVDAESATAKNN